MSLTALSNTAPLQWRSARVRSLKNLRRNRHFGAGDGISSEIDELVGNPTVYTDTETTVKFVKVNGKLYSMLYLLANGDDFSMLYLFRVKRDELKGDGPGAWKAIIKKYEGSIGQHRMELRY